jgi:hypothetical protein
MSARTPGMRIHSAIAALRNTGTIEVSNGSAFVLASTWHNDGTFVLGQGTLALAGTFKSSDIGSIARAAGSTGTLQIGNFDTDGPLDALDNHNETLALNPSVGPWYLRGTIAGGTISSTTAPNLIFAGGSLDGVTLDGSFSYPVPTAVRIVNDCTFAPGTRYTINSISVSAEGALETVDTASVQGSGEIVFDGPGTTGRVGGFNPGLMTSGPNILIRTGASGGVVGRLINHGTISSQTAGSGFPSSASSRTWARSKRAMAARSRSAPEAFLTIRAEPAALRSAAALGKSLLDRR